jgi:VanZ family protein
VAPATAAAENASPPRTHPWQPGTRVLFWLAVILVTVMSLMPSDRLPDFTASIWDKAQHAGGFAALAALGIWGYGRAQWAEGRVLLGLIAFGIAIEVAQGATGWRHADAWDAVADAVGVALGWACARAAARWWAL